MPTCRVKARLVGFRVSKRSPDHDPGYQSGAPCCAHRHDQAPRCARSVRTDTTAPDVIALHIAAENALEHGVSMLRNPAGTAADLQRATARVIRASSLLGNAAVRPRWKVRHDRRPAYRCRAWRSHHRCGT